VSWLRSPREATRRGTLTALAILLASPGAGPGSADPLSTRSTPAAGRFLVATRQVAGPIFGRSIVLLIDANAKGAAGLVVNRPSRFPLREIFDELPETRTDPIYLGGPVEPRGMLLLMRTKRPPGDSRKIVDDLHLGHSADALREMIGRDLPPDRMRAFVGYAGWSPGQLEHEIERGDWFVIERDPELAFEARGDESWEKLVQSLESIRVERPRGERVLDAASSADCALCLLHELPEPRGASRPPGPRLPG